MEQLICDICSKPTCICTCDVSWSTFDTLIAKCSGVKNENIVYTDLSISTMTVCFNFNQPIDLKLLKEQLPPTLNTSYRPDSKKSKVVKKKGTDSFYNSFDIKIGIADHSKSPAIFSNVSIFIFPNGKVKTAGAKTIQTINSTIEELINIIKYVPGTVSSPDTFAAENVKIQMICSDFKIKPCKENNDGWCLKQEELKNILVKEKLSATFSGLSRYPGINLKIPSLIQPDKNVSLLIFRSGSIIITGAKFAKDIIYCYTFITEVIAKNLHIFYYDINEEIKQKKKKK